ncbi:MAG TPA: membrane protein insertase YidC [Gemmatimonadales bacterium]|nr:membrane protein insertase YidC [Gemmatimonadales bacterium]
MERRLVIAILLMIVVAVVPSLFFKSTRRPTPGSADTTHAAVPAAETTRAAARAPRTVPPAPSRSAAPVAAVPAETTTVVTAGARYTLTSLGAAISGAEFPRYQSYAGPGKGKPVELLRPGDRMLAPQLVIGRDTLALDSVSFSMESTAEGATFRGHSGAVGLQMTVAARAGADYLLDVNGEVEGLGGQGALLLVGLGSGFANVEADSLGNYRGYAVVGRRTEPVSLAFSKLKPGQTAALDGPFDWVAVKSKYFIGAVMSADSSQLFGGAVATGGPMSGRYQTTAVTWATLPVGPDGRFRYSLYLGPQEYRQLRRLGRDLDKASTYGWIFKPIVMPVSVWITQLLLWLHQRLSLAYGWVLILFGLAIRLALWPLNQKAMMSSVAMQAIQPLMKDIQTRHKEDPQRLQQEMMKLYREHKVNPFGSCLPMLLPFPILLALFFVFANTIAFRGAAFLWLPDLSLRDPTYIIPLVMGGSMYALSRLGQMGMPPNPQAKMMTTVMPIMMTVLFLNFASGLNLYYAVSNLVSLPQQYLINRARIREMARRKALT